jgi:hypothetical protein
MGTTLLVIGLSFKLQSLKLMCLLLLMHGVNVVCPTFFQHCFGKTSPHELKYMSDFEDEFGNVVHKEINRPKVCHFLYEYLPLIDEHNKQRQNLLNLEQCWCTKDSWMQLWECVLLTCTNGTKTKSMRSTFERLVGSLLVTSFWQFGNSVINSVLVLRGSK